MFGVAVGDALGVPVEFYNREARRQDPVTGMRSGGFHDQRAGTWSDDTSMALALMDSLTRKGFDCEDQMRCYVDWLWNAKYTAYDDVFDVGGTCKSAIFRFCKGTPADRCGEDGENTCGNGSLMRIMPLALYLYGTGRGELNDETAALIHTSSAVTHAHLRCCMACGTYCSVVFCLCGGMDRHAAVREGIGRALAYYGRKEQFVTEMEMFQSLESIGVWPEQMIHGSGYVLHTLQAALWCFLRTENYTDCVLQAVNLGEDTDTTAAVAGGLAGLYYGEESIPTEWLDVLARREDIRYMCAAFADSLIGNAG
jgi:ADP-ribosylglycohydrolase